MNDNTRIGGRDRRVLKLEWIGVWRCEDGLLGLVYVICALLESWNWAALMGFFEHEERKSSKNFFPLTR